MHLGAVEWQLALFLQILNFARVTDSPCLIFTHVDNIHRVDRALIELNALIELIAPIALIALTALIALMALIALIARADRAHRVGVSLLDCAHRVGVGRVKSPSA